VRIGILAGVLAIIVVASCQPRSSGGGTGERFESLADLKPESQIPANANLKIADIDMPVEVTQTTTDDATKISLSAHGQIFETEVYSISEKEFSLFDAAGETYDDPLPLLKFPLTVGDTWKWSGTMTAGTAPHKASAVVATSAETLRMTTTGSTPSVLVVVDLEIESGAQEPAKRKLRFWFVKDKGVVQRQFGIGSTREPVE
jgi:hypothetical protein